MTFLKQEFQDYQELYNQMSDLYYTKQWEQLYTLYLNSNLPEIYIDENIVSKLKELNCLNKEFLKGCLYWRQCDNFFAERIMHVIISSAYYYFISNEIEKISFSKSS